MFRLILDALRGFFLLLPVFIILLLFPVHMEVWVHAQDSALHDKDSSEDLSIEEDSSFKDEILINDHIMMPETLLQRIQANKNDFILYDLRETSLYAQGHIEGSLLCTWDNGNFKKKSEEFPLDRDIIVISENGGDGIKAVQFPRVYSVEGGMENWLYREYLIH